MVVPNDISVRYVRPLLSMHNLRKGLLALGLVGAGAGAHAAYVDYRDYKKSFLEQQAQREKLLNKIMSGKRGIPMLIGAALGSGLGSYLGYRIGEDARSSLVGGLSGLGAGGVLGYFSSPLFTREVEPSLDESWLSNVKQRFFGYENEKAASNRNIDNIVEIENGSTNLAPNAINGAKKIPLLPEFYINDPYSTSFAGYMLGSTLGGLGALSYKTMNPDLSWRNTMLLHGGSVLTGGLLGAAAGYFLNPYLNEFLNKKSSGNFISKFAGSVSDDPVPLKTRVLDIISRRPAIPIVAMGIPAYFIVRPPVAGIDLVIKAFQKIKKYPQTGLSSLKPSTLVGLGAAIGTIPLGVLASMKAESLLDEASLPPGMTPNDFVVKKTVLDYV